MKLHELIFPSMDDMREDREKSQQVFDAIDWNKEAELCLQSEMWLPAIVGPELDGCDFMGAWDMTMFVEWLTDDNAKDTASQLVAVKKYAELAIGRPLTKADAYCATLGYSMAHEDSRAREHLRKIKSGIESAMLQGVADESSDAAI